MKKWVIFAIAGLTLTGCASTAMPEADYYEVVRGTDGLDGLSDESIKDVGRAVCGVFGAESDPWLKAVKQMTDTGMEARTAGSLIAYSVTQYCPEHTADLPN